MSPLHPELGSRALFPDLAERIYLNHAAVSPLSAPVQEAINVVNQDFARHGMAAALRAGEQLTELRSDLGAFLECPADDLGLVGNTTQGVSAVAMALPWRPGDRVLLFEGEFPANTTPWQQAAEVFDLDLEFLPLAPFQRSTEEGLATTAAALEKGCRLMAVSLVQFQSGLRMPIEALAEQVHGAGGELFVDGIQGLGALPFSPVAAGVDYLAAGGHKWMMGAFGAGFLYARRSCAEAFIPRTFGWTSHVEPFEFLAAGAGHLRYDRPFRKDASVVEGGSLCFMAFAALHRAVQGLTELGPAAIFQHIQAYHDDIEPRLVALGFRSLRGASVAQRSASLCFDPPEDVDLGALVAALAERGVAVSMPDGRLRISPHWPNALNEVEYLSEAIGDVLARSH